MIIMVVFQVFDGVRGENPELLQKLVPVQGDLTLPGLGISEADQETLTSCVSVVFHSGATVKFDEPLKSSVEVNVVGTRRVLEFCHKIRKLQVRSWLHRYLSSTTCVCAHQALVHLSTAYSNCDRREIDEVVYPSPVPPQKVIEAVDWLDDETLTSITPHLIKNKPNAYTYTKALAENLLVEERGQLPVAVVRPSIVTAAWQEPLPGWVDNMNGPTGIIVASMKGIFSSMHCDRSCVADLIPVDIVINLVIAVACYTAMDKSSEVAVYNCTSGNLNRLTWGRLADVGFPVIRAHPATGVLGVPRGNLRDSRLANWYCILAHHLIPAYLLDLGLLLTRQRPRFVKIYSRLHRAEDTLHFFTTNQWRFTSNNVVALFDRLSDSDKKVRSSHSTVSLF
ncbi:hypothetical protein LAZ67_17001112 [Cordylochernes scorpioides]|uniref:Fatty acyl-CoA reductase n=1 Tax=Cordylochernes scorpioides TaxID=51811 RepID=A0ABY6LD21_9ARAC|nr:hypothetical protein LAZ67_17001112 [Cordylochernes scorpioides]